LAGAQDSYGIDPLLITTPTLQRRVFDCLARRESRKTTTQLFFFFFSRLFLILLGVNVAQQRFLCKRHNRNEQKSRKKKPAEVPSKKKERSVNMGDTLTGYEARIRCRAIANSKATTEAAKTVEVAKNKLIEKAQRHLSFNSAPSPATRNPELPLYDVSSIPEWLKGNPFILSYYRAGYTTKQCFKSIFAMHNETLNIWTHLIGFLIILALSAHILVNLELHRTRDYLVFSVFQLGSMVMLGGSSVYHTLSAHRCEEVHNVALALDYFGITAMIVGSFYPPVFYLFSCSNVVRAAYLVAITLLGILGLMGPFFTFFNTQMFYWPRMILYSSLTSVGILPTIHMFVGLPTNEQTVPLYKGMFLMLVTYCVGMVIYIFKIPERWYPGHFDLLLHSHQLWHFFVLGAAVVHYFTCIGAFQMWRVTGGFSGECS
jgi:adiponectin receptor